MFDIKELYIRNIVQVFIDFFHIAWSSILAFCLILTILYKIQRGSKSLKVSIAIIFGLCASGVTLYAFKQSKDNRKILEFQKAFYANGILACTYHNKMITIQKQDFIYMTDSLIFLGKDSKSGISINILDCESYEIPLGDEILTD